MKKMTTVVELREQIALLEIKQANDKQLLKEEFKTTYESLRPVNLIKKTLNELTTAPDFKGNILGTIISIAAGYLSKKATVGSTHNPIKQLLGTVLQVAVTGMVSKNSDGIKDTLKNLLNKLLSKKDTTAKEN